jgi:hypothetical protein
MRYNTGLAASTLWIDQYENSESVSATDAASPITVSQFAFRQDGLSGGIGRLLVDNLKVATSFAGVTEDRVHPAPLMIERIGTSLVITWLDASYRLQTSEGALTDFADLLGAVSPYTNRLSARAAFFRLAR